MPESKVQRRRLALLGATGRTGHQILQKLLQEPIVGSISTSTFAQGQSLTPSSPSLSSYPHLTIFHSSLNKTLIRECLAQVDTIICTIGENENIPGVTVLQDSARVTLTALSSLKTRRTLSIILSRIGKSEVLQRVRRKHSGSCLDQFTESGIT